MNYEFVARHDGFYNYDGNKIEIEDIIAAHIKSGGKVERRIEPTKIYKKNEEVFEIEEKICEIIKFY